MPDIKIGNFDVEKAAADLNNAVKEAAYVAVGLGVLGFQKAQVQRVELTKQLEAQLAQINGLVSTLGSQVDTYVATAREQFEGQVGKLSTDLPDATAVRSQLTELAKSVDEAMAPARQQLQEQLDRLERALPETARTLVHNVRTAALTQEQALRSAVGLDQ